MEMKLELKRFYEKEESEIKMKSEIDRVLIFKNLYRWDKIWFQLEIRKLKNWMNYFKEFLRMVV